MVDAAKPISSCRWVKAGKAWVLAGVAGLAPTGSPAFWADSQAGEDAVRYYSTAAPPRDYPGPAPVLLALVSPTDPPPAPTTESRIPAAEPPVLDVTKPQAAPRVAAVPADLVTSPRPSVPIAQQPPLVDEPSAPPDPIVESKRAIAECRTRYLQVQDYTCSLIKRERIDGRLSAYHILSMKARARPLSIYFKFQKPTPGREAIYVAGRNGGRVLAHDVGIGKVLAGTLALDPKGSRAMDDSRHPITEAGIGHLIDTVADRWNAEMKHGETLVTIHPHARVGSRPCTLIESTHPQKHPKYLFYKVKVFIDQDLNLPIRFEAYDWPRRQGQTAELMEEYTYSNVQLNVGLRDRDFDSDNPQYSFGHF